MIDARTLAQHAGFIRSLARGLVADDAAAEDVVQQTLVAAITAPPRDERALRSWLARVASNFARRTRRDSGTRVRHERAAARPERVDGPADAAGHESVIRGVVDAVFELEETYRSVVLLRFYEDLTPAEIAARLGVPVETVRTRLKRAIGKMRARLDSRNGGDRRAWSAALVPFLGSAEPPAASPSALVGEAVKAGRSTSFASPLVLAAAILLVGSALFFALRDGAAPSSGAGATSAAAPAMARAEPEPSSAEGDPAGELPATVASASADPAVAASGPGSVLLRLSWEEDGKPAEGIRMRLVPLSEANRNPAPQGHLLGLLTGPDGTVRATGLAAGEHVLLSDRMERRAGVMVEAGREIELPVLVPVGLTVEGLVAGPTGEAVPEAEIVFCSSAPSDFGALMARTRHDGTFRVRSISVPGYLGARASKLAPSMMSPVTGEPGRPIVGTLNLRLFEVGGDVEGRVVDGDGRPIEAANVYIGEVGDETLDSAAPSHAVAIVARARPLPTVGGEFRAAGLRVGERPIIAHAASFGPVRTSVRVEAGATTTVEIRLGPGPTLEGTIRGRDGEAAEGAWILANSSDFADVGIRSAALTGPDGSYRIDNLFSDARVFVQAISEKEQSVAEAWFQLGDSGTVRWDATLGSLPAVRGRLLGEDGSPLASWDVMAMAPAPDPLLDSPIMPGFFLGRVRTGPDGRFEIPCRGRAYRLQFFEPDAGPISPCLEVPDVEPGPDERTIVVPSATRPSAFVTGRVVAESEDESLGPASVWAKPPTEAHALHVTRLESDGSFRLGPLRPGRYHVYVGIGAYSLNLRENEEFTPGQTLDVGSVRVSKPGSLAVHLSRAGVPCDERPAAQVYDERFELAGRATQLGSVMKVAALAPGRYRLGLLAFASNVISDEHSFEIRSGEETRLDVELRSGIRVPVHFAQPAGEEWSSEVRARLLDATGAVFWRVINLGCDVDHRFRVTLYLAPGRYTIEATGDAGMSATRTFEVVADGPAEQPVEVMLSPPR